MQNPPRKRGTHRHNFFCVSAVRYNLPLETQPPRAQAPPSIMSISKKNKVDGYVGRFDPRTFPLVGMLNEYGGISNLTKAQRAQDWLHAKDGMGMRGVVGGASTMLLFLFASEKNPLILGASLPGAWRHCAGLIAWEEEEALEEGRGSIVRTDDGGGDAPEKMIWFVITPWRCTLDALIN